MRIDFSPKLAAAVRDHLKTMATAPAGDAARPQGLAALGAMNGTKVDSANEDVWLAVTNALDWIANGFDADFPPAIKNGARSRLRTIRVHLEQS